MIQKKWIVAVTAGKWQIHGIKEAQAAGLGVIAIDDDTYAAGLSIADIGIPVGIHNTSAIVQQLHSLNLLISGVVCFCSEVGMLPAAKIREALKIQGLTVDQTLKLTDKALQRQLWKNARVPSPQFKVVDTLKDAVTTLSLSKSPTIIKPTDSSGSRGVIKIEPTMSPTRCRQAIKDAFAHSSTSRILIEEYMEGTEFTVETFVTSGKVIVLAVTEKKKIEHISGCVSYELSTPAVDAPYLTSLKHTVIRAFEALEYKNGPGHAEVILMKDGRIGMVEVAGRGGGFLVADRLVPLISGVNVARLTALQASGEPIRDIPISSKKSAVLRFIPSREGQVYGFSGFTEAQKLEGVEADSFVCVGDKVRQPQSDGDRLGYILALADSPSQAQQKADQAESLLSYDIR